MNTEDFFQEASEASQVKKIIVAKYFRAWANVMIPTVKKRGNSEIGYVDLFSGPGKYADGIKSTPLVIVEEAIRDEKLRSMLRMIFNDKDTQNAEALGNELTLLPGIDTLRFKPNVLNKEVNEEILKDLREVLWIPTFYFVDPWGYKGVTRDLISSLIKGWGCDCIVFFNYLRINMGLDNPVFQDHMEALFGAGRLKKLKTLIVPLGAGLREMMVVEEFCQALIEKGGNYVIPFCFKNDRGTRTSHYLIFISKGFAGYEIMKEIMAGESSTVEEGVPSFEYCPAEPEQQLLFAFSSPLKDLEAMLLETFAGQTLSMDQIYRMHSVGRWYVRRNYKSVLEKLELDGKITVDPPYTKRRKTKGKVSFADKVMVTFPRKEN